MRCEAWAQMKGREKGKRCEQTMQTGYERKRWWEQEIHKQEVQDGRDCVRANKRCEDEMRARDEGTR